MFTIVMVYVLISKIQRNDSISNDDGVVADCPGRIFLTS